VSLKKSENDVACRSVGPVRRAMKGLIGAGHDRPAGSIRQRKVKYRIEVTRMGIPARVFAIGF